jgi:hypothetical protein
MEEDTTQGTEECCKRSFGDSLRDTAKRLLENPRIAPRRVARERMAICEECPRYISEKMQCSICQCIMPLKTTMSNMKCPIDKWAEYRGPGEVEEEGEDEN